MTLSISVMVGDDFGAMKPVENWATPPRNDLFGVETCRQELWGAPVMSTLGLTLIPTLLHANIAADDDDFDLLEREAKTILANLPLVEEKTGVAQPYIEFRILNLLAAIEKAHSLKDQHACVRVDVD